mmetsp:Transcript_8367/g.10754  ORF Transcript_8367/g.10754 Transcript_8367/m.10754 type:complete len:143 (+) Transcript_8367:259-687(+)
MSSQSSTIKRKVKVASASLVLIFALSNNLTSSFMTPYHHLRQRSARTYNHKNGRSKDGAHDSFVWGAKNPNLSAKSKIVDSALVQRIRLGCTYKGKGTHAAKLMLEKEKDIPSHRGVFVGFKVTEEEFKRLKSANPSDYIDD